MVNTGDFKYSTSSGLQSHSKGINERQIPFGRGFGCELNQQDGTARVDFTGTRFALDDTFNFSGFRPVGRSSQSGDGKTADLWGGGFCGWIAPRSIYTNEELAHRGGWDLRVKIV